MDQGVWADSDHGLHMDQWVRVYELLFLDQTGEGYEFQGIHQIKNLPKSTFRLLLRPVSDQDMQWFASED